MTGGNQSSALGNAAAALDDADRLSETISSRCRVCGSTQILKMGEIEFYFGYCWPVYDCDFCGCRSTLHDAGAYELLYRERGSCYNRYLGLAEAAKRLFDARDLPGLRAELAKSSRYRFIIEQLAKEPSPARLLEIGSSRGHLTSYFILSGYAVTGVDVSTTAVGSAAADFGDYFRSAGDPRIAAGAPYDVIFHVGTIGCVADPLGLTRDLLNMLRPGGRLLFNAPNRESCLLPGQLWLESTPPPDLVTMYPPGFWPRHFGDVAFVEERIEHEAPLQNLLIGLRRLARRKWRKPVPIVVSESQATSEPAPSWTDQLWRNVERAVRRIAPISVCRLARARPTPFGLFVVMTKR